MNYGDGNETFDKGFERGCKVGMAIGALMGLCFGVICMCTENSLNERRTIRSFQPLVCKETEVLRKVGVGWACFSVRTVEKTK